MKQYLLDTFLYNDSANRQVLKSILDLPDKTEAVKLFSHLINSQDKWMDRILLFPDASKLDWWEPTYAVEELEIKWRISINTWIDFLWTKSEKELFEEIKFIGFDNGVWACQLKDIALQLNYHSIHHRAQIQTLIRQQGLTPGFIDYIGTTYRKLT